MLADLTTAYWRSVGTQPITANPPSMTNTSAAGSGTACVPSIAMTSVAPNASSALVKPMLRECAIRKPQIV
jgi:hypothetical protein